MKSEIDFLRSFFIDDEMTCSFLRNKNDILDQIKKRVKILEVMKNERT